MKKHDLLKDGNNIIRVLEVTPDKILVIDCIKKTMPVWVESSALDSFSGCTDEVLNEATNFAVTAIDALDADQRKAMYDRCTLIAPILPFVVDERMRSKVIGSIATEYNISKHTMFSCYGRFLPRERRQKAFQSLVSMMGNYYNLLPIPQSKNGKVRCLRYCPACAANDREQYGEAYCSLSLANRDSCLPVHRCYLMDSGVIISGKATPSFKTAEEMIPQSESCVFYRVL